MKFDILPIPQHYHQQQYQQHYLTIEDIKSTRNSCWLCGCNWLEDHVSLDCSECGGYALTRPCVNCDGKCGETWERDISRSHDSHQARFSGRCRLHPTNDRDDGTHTDDDDLLLSKSERIAQLLRSTTTRNGKRTTSGQQQSGTLAMHHQAGGLTSAYQWQHDLAKASNKTTGMATTTAKTSCFASSSSCCSSQPSSATNSDEDQDN